MPLEPPGSGLPPADEDAAIARVVTRLSGEYVLRAFQLLVDVFGDIRAGLLVEAINTANIAALARSDDGRRAAGPDGLYPDEARRPISIGRLADSTGLPFESTRRIVQRLVERGACVRVGGGVIVPRATLQGPSITRITLANLDYVRRFLRDVRAAGLVEDGLAGRLRYLEGAEEAALAFRVAPVSNAYILRALRLLADTYGDIRTGIVAQTIVTANTAHLDGRLGEGRRFAGIAEPPPDEARRPIGVSRLAESLAVPYETMRRQVRRLLDAGVCVRVKTGVIVPKAALETPAAVRSTLTNVSYVRKFVRDVQAVGPDEPPTS